jgi:hypothetical protein
MQIYAKIIRFFAFFGENMRKKLPLKADLQF